MKDFEFIDVQRSVGSGVARISLDRPEVRNAQNRGLLVELDVAFGLLEQDDEVRVIVLRGNGGSFSSGHDLGSAVATAERSSGEGQHPTYAFNGGTCEGIENRWRQEYHYYFDNTRRWRSLRKITIAQTEGTVLSAGLMLAWCCDLIVATPDTLYADVVGTRLGMCGVEYFGHPWEFGPRKAKEILLTGDAIDAVEAHALGMVSKLFSAEEVDQKTLEFAERIALVPSVTALAIKDSVNHSVDAMGFNVALDSAFGIHQLNHAHWSVLSGGRTAIGTPEFGLPDWRTAGRVRPARADDA